MKYATAEREAAEQPLTSDVEEKNKMAGYNEKMYELKACILP